MEKIRILLVDDHVVLREGMRSLLEEEKDLEVVGEASDGLEAIKRTAELQPDVILMDIVMPKVNGVEATREIRKANPAAHVLVLTAYSDISYILGLLEAGACGYVLKNARRTEIVGAIRAAYFGDSVLAPLVTQKLLQRITRQTDSSLRDHLKENISLREQEILSLAARGMSNKDIAHQLSLSVRTVKTHLTNLFNKMGVSCRTEAIIKGFKEGYLDLQEISLEED
jgi:DNA-binding NarL/FixJ family response regulator